MLRVLLLGALAVMLATPAYAQRDNAELRRPHDADQADREALEAGTTTWEQVLLGTGTAQTPADLFHAALVLQHSSDPCDLYRAHALALASYEMDGNADARWLVPRGYDRWQPSLGKPQVYGTQLVGTVPDGADPHAPGAAMVWSLGNADLDAVTDAERERWGLRPAAERIAVVACMNERQGTGEADFSACQAAARAATDAGE